MELLLWRWSTAVQISSAVMIAIFFSALVRSDPRADLRWWFRAWVINVAALSVTLAYWYIEPPEAFRPLVRALYVSGKTTFLLLLLQGAWALLRPGSILLTVRQLVAVAIVVALLGAFVLTSVTLVGVGQSIAIALLMTAGGIALARAGEQGVTWLAAGLGIRAALGYVEAGAYLSQLVPLVPATMTESVAVFLSAHSSLDTGAEWLIALGCVLAIADRTQTDMRMANERLLAAQFDLRRLADRDPLTGLANRRTLPEIFRSVQPLGATLLFFDLDGFKAINDLHGHPMGDQCLKQFASALRECFRPDDAVVRFAGDEFVVVASGLDRAAVDDRIGALRSRLRKVAANLPELLFSVGLADLPPGGLPDAALQAADEAMYRAKGSARRASASA